MQYEKYIRLHHPEAEGYLPLTVELFRSFLEYGEAPRNYFELCNIPPELMTPELMGELTRWMLKQNGSHCGDHFCVSLTPRTMYPRWGHAVETWYWYIEIHGPQIEELAAELRVYERRQRLRALLRNTTPAPEEGTLTTAYFMSLLEAATVNGPIPHYMLCHIEISEMTGELLQWLSKWSAHLERAPGEGDDNLKVQAYPYTTDFHQVPDEYTGEVQWLWQIDVYGPATFTMVASWQRETHRRRVRHNFYTRYRAKRRVSRELNMQRLLHKTTPTTP